MLQPQRHQFFCASSQHVNNRAVSTDGFTLVEVIVAILIVTTFVAVALQGMWLALLLKSKNLQLAEANRWVQQDVERIRSQLTIDRLPLSNHEQLCHPSAAELGFADLLRDSLASRDVTGTEEYSLAPLVTTSVTSRTFQIARKLSIPAIADNLAAKILGIEYTVAPTHGANVEAPILHLYTEVMPDAALQCQ